MPDIKFSGKLQIRRSYTDEEHKLTGGSFIINQVGDAHIGIFFNQNFMEDLCTKNNIKRLKSDEVEQIEAEITLKIPANMTKPTD
ncbi:hypothetical protein ACFL0V_00680 [Nanoarchaeota archaeon]